jgi:serine/threonine protein kinase
VTGAPSDLVGQSLGPVQLERVLGQGGFSWVFAGREPDGTPVAVKVLKPRYVRDPEYEARFLREGETAARLEHPHIVHIRSIAKTGAHVYFTMDLYADTLAARLAREGPLTEPVLVRIAWEISLGLAFAHARGYVHRDLKPENILLSDGRAVITDFGIARALQNFVPSTGVDLTLGTPQYLSPEQAQGRPIDHRADFYGLGITLYKAATGDVPFNHSQWFELARMHVEDEALPLRQRRPGLSRRFERVVARCLAKHPDDRYRDAAELSADLVAIEARQRATPEDGAARDNWRLLEALRERPPWPRIALGLGILILLLVAMKLVH